MRLIDAEQLEQIFNTQVDEGATDLFDAFDYAIEHADTIDPSSLVKRGRWEVTMNGNGWIAWYELTCSVCKKTFKDLQASNFCPNCGAMMGD